MSEFSWEEEAKRYAENADFWRSKFEALEAELKAQGRRQLAGVYECVAECIEGSSYPCNPSCADHGWCYTRKVEAHQQENNND